jgi:hypothetical protein
MRVAAFQEPGTGTGGAGQQESIAVPTVRHDSLSFRYGLLVLCKHGMELRDLPKRVADPCVAGPPGAFPGARHWGIRGWRGAGRAESYLVPKMRSPASPRPGRM